MSLLDADVTFGQENDFYASSGEWELALNVDKEN